MDIPKLFETDLANALAAKPDVAQRVGVKFQFNITGEGGGQWFVDASSTGPKVEAANPGNADCTISMSAEDFEQLWQNPSSGMRPLLLRAPEHLRGSDAGDEVPGSVQAL